jgi:hypothetical protein
VGNNRAKIASDDVRHGLDVFLQPRLKECGAEKWPAPLRRQRLAPSLRQIEREAANRSKAIRRAYATGAYTLAEIGAHFGVHYATIRRIARHAWLGGSGASRPWFGLPAFPRRHVVSLKALAALLWRPETLPSGFAHDRSHSTQRTSLCAAALCARR